MYSYLPEILQDIVVSYRGWRLVNKRQGVHFQKAYREFVNRTFWSKDQLLDYRSKMLENCLERASKTPYYSNLFREMGATWQDFKDYNNFNKLPIITKSDVKNRINDFKPRATNKSDSIIKTSGTTGESFSFPVSENFESEQWAVWWRYRNWHGIYKGDCCGLFASAPILYGELKGRPWRYNYANNEYRFSIFHISKKTIFNYVKSIEKIGPKWLHGNPTALALLASFIIEFDFYPNLELKCVTVGSENLLDWQKNVIEKAFRTEVNQHYGLAEGVANISQCEYGALHVDEDYSYLEFIKNDKSDICTIVGTPFNNFALSILRYDTGDLATVKSSGCSCGRFSRTVDSLDGRITDYIYLPNGEKVASLAAPFHAIDGLAGAQIYQGIKGDLTIRYIPTKNWSDTYLKNIEKSLRIRVGNEIPIYFQKVHEIEKTSRGKMKLVVSDYVC